MKKNNYLEGIYRRNAKGFGFVKVENMEDEIYISKDKSKNALNEDKVLIEIIEEKSENKKAEGRIVEILGRQKDTIVGIFQKSKNFGFVVPDNKNFGTDIFISKKDCGKARNNHKVLVKITKYPKKGKNAEGKIIEILGGVNEAGVDMLSLIKEYDLPYVFPKAVVNEAKSKGNKINEKDIKNRKDLRNDIVFTIDGQDAKDLDDAVSVKKLENGNYKLDVHIADVSYYVRENSLLDKEAQIRGTSIYMLGRVIPMLPRELSNGICSLNEGEDRYTLSCTMEINSKGNVVSSDVYKAVINVTKRMNYHDVQAILDDSNKEITKKYKDYISNFKLMEELAKILKNKRAEQGYLNLEIPESKIDLDINGRVTNISKYETSFANEIIEQFMLKANETIAEKFFWLDAPFIYRVHEEPDIDKVKELNNDEDVIKMFIEFCKKGNVDNAYNMISDSCKKTLFTTQKEFSEKYYNTYFSNQTIIKISKYNDNGTYKVDYSLDPLITGSSENSKITDYITITKDKKLNVGGFIKNVALNKKTQNSYVKINVISKDVFWDHENYNVELDNLISAKIYLDTKSTERNSFVSNENNTCYYIDIDNYDDSDLEVQGNKSKKITLKFNKKYNENDEIVTMNFNNIVIENYEYGDKNSINKNDILGKSGETTYERKYTTYPEKVTLRVDFK